MDEATLTESVWKIFVPCDLLNESDSLLFGHVISTNQSVCITASASSRAVVKEEIRGLDFVGCWSQKDKFDKKQDDRTKHSVWVLLCYNDQSHVTCRMFIDNLLSPCTCIVYNPAEFLHSSVINDRCLPDRKPETSSLDNITALAAALHKTKSSFQSLNQSVSGKWTKYCGEVDQERNLLRTTTEKILSLLMYIYLPFQLLFSSSFENKFFHSPTFMSQLQSRAADLQQVKFNSDTRPLERIRHLNRCWRQVVDTTLGVCLMVYLTRGVRANLVAHSSLKLTDLVAADLKDLLHWLMGAPAGLKLNSQLTHFLGNFFLYHIHLWTGFLYLIQSILGDLVYYCSISGVFGLTVQLALFQDIFSVLTLHIYCFYVYAARLYKLQLYALGSLWRLFRGKKWNVLRQRVDSASYDVDQLFLGTLLFTILLFLLPTIGLYYVVFAMLRLLILGIQSLVGKLRQLFNSFQVWSLCLWLGRSSTFTDGAVFHVQEAQSSNECLVLRVQTIRLGLSAVLDISDDGDNKTMLEADKDYSAGQVFRKLIHGDLIYPWIEKKQKS